MLFSSGRACQQTHQAAVGFGDKEAPHAVWVHGFHGIVHRGFGANGFSVLFHATDIAQSMPQCKDDKNC